MKAVSSKIKKNIKGIPLIPQISCNDEALQKEILICISSKGDDNYEILKNLFSVVFQEIEANELMKGFLLEDLRFFIDDFLETHLCHQRPDDNLGNIDILFESNYNQDYFDDLI
jgi:hypothetical protein